jgi:hypothetical protein
MLFVKNVKEEKKEIECFLKIVPLSFLKKAILLVS